MTVIMTLMTLMTLIVPERTLRVSLGAVEAMLLNHMAVCVCVCVYMGGWDKKDREWVR
jgi:hypothetical protein